MEWARALLKLSIFASLLAACAPAGGPAAQPAGGQEDAARVEPSRTLVMVVGQEPRSLALKALGLAGVTIGGSRRLFNAALTIVDAQGKPLPYLAEALPQLNTETWKVLPDGRMETFYRLRVNATWHDGTPLTADDFVFSWQVYATPELGQAGSPPLNLIEEVSALDKATFLIRWRRSYPDAGTLAGGFPALPRHILEPTLAELRAGSIGVDTFINHQYWTLEFVGLGPYRLDRWEPAAFLEGVAFDNHVLGRPKIARVVVNLIPDQNTALARLLAGEAHYAADSAIGNGQALVLKREWGPRSGGATLVKPDFWKAGFVQLRPELATPRALLDRRVRAALAHAVDKEPVNDRLFEGTGTLTDSPLIPPTVAYYVEVDRALTKFPYDLRRSEQLMREAGFTKGTDGVYQSPADGRPVWEVKQNASIENEAEIAILASGWRQAGFDFREVALPAAQAQDGQVRASFPTVYVFGTPVGESALAGWNTAGIPRPENRWSGSNRGGWANPEFDRLAQALPGTIEPAERAQLVVQMVAIFSEDVPAIPLYFYGLPVAHSAALQGPHPVVQQSSFEWNIHLWELH